MKTGFSVIVLSFILLFAATANAQSPPSCNAAPPTTAVVNPNTVLFIGSADHVTVTAYKIGIFAEGVNPNISTPISEIVIPKSVLAQGVEANCWYTKPDMTFLLGTPVAAVTPYRAAMKAIRDTDATEGDWSVVSNPFVKAGPKPGTASAVKVIKQ